MGTDGQLHFELLAERHAIETFFCGNDALEKWLGVNALKGNANGVARTYVLVRPNASEDILAFGSLSAMWLGRNEELTGAQQRKARGSGGGTLPSKVPAIMLGRMAVRSDMQGAGLGRIILHRLEATAMEARERIGAVFLVVDAKDGVQDFYTRLGFKPSKSDPNRLLLQLRLYGDDE